MPDMQHLHNSDCVAYGVQHMVYIEPLDMVASGHAVHSLTHKQCTVISSLSCRHTYCPSNMLQPGKEGKWVMMYQYMLHRRACNQLQASKGLHPLVSSMFSCPQFIMLPSTAGTAGMCHHHHHHAPASFDFCVLLPQAMARLQQAMSSMLSWVQRFLRAQPAQNATVEVGPGEGAGGGAVRPMCVRQVADIEENVWAPRYGLKGMIDASLAVGFQPQVKHCSVTVLLSSKISSSTAVLFMSTNIGAVLRNTSKISSCTAALFMSTVLAAVLRNTT